jgi:hypothetical protein
MIPHGIGKHNLTVPVTFAELTDCNPGELAGVVPSGAAREWVVPHTDFASSLGAIRRLMEDKGLGEAACQLMTTVKFLTTSERRATPGGIAV